MNLRTTALVFVLLTGGLCISPARAQFSAFAHVTRANQKDYNVDVRILPVDAQGKQYRVVVSGVCDSHRAYVVVCREPVAPEKQNFRAHLRHERRSRDDVLSVSPLPLRPTLKSAYIRYLECVVDTSRFARSYIYIDYPDSMVDGGYYYSIDLATFLPPDVLQATIRYSPARGRGPRRAPGRTVYQSRRRSACPGWSRGPGLALGGRGRGLDQHRARGHRPDSAICPRRRDIFPGSGRRKCPARAGRVPSEGVS